KPLAGARIFLASDASLTTVTDRHGKFHLPGVPLGRQSLVIVAEDVGEEYAFEQGQAEAIDLGTLVYHVPPLRVRMQPGNGAEWLSGEEQSSAQQSGSKTATPVSEMGRE